MIKDIKEYLLYYIDGVDYRIRYVDNAPGTWSVWSKLTPGRYSRAVEDFSVAEIQIQLRRLESITDAELKERHFRNRDHYQDWLNHNDQKWPIEDLLWFLKNGFDMFELIREGLAVDKETLVRPEIKPGE